MKRSLLASLLLACFMAGCASTPSTPANWVALSGKGHFIDTNSIIDKGNGVKQATDKNLFSPPKKGEDFTNNKPIARADFTIYYNCNNFTFAIKGMAYYDVNDEVTFQGTLEENELKWRHETAGSSGEAAWNFVCKGKKKHRS